MGRGRRSGAALLLVLLVLGLLSSLAIGLYAIVRVERLAATNHLAQGRARLVAEAGIQRAISELSSSELDDPTGTGGGWKIQEPGVPIEKGTAFAWTGDLGGTFADQGDRWSVRVADTSAKLDLNARPEVIGPALDALGRAIALERARTGAGAEDPVRGRGATIAAFVAERGRLASVQELAPVIGAADAAALADFVTVHAQRDPRTWRWTGERDQRGYPLTVPEPRAAVCANTASFPVLVAVFEGVTGRDGVPVTTEQAVGLARWVIAWRESVEIDRGPFATWEAFARLMDGAAPTVQLTPAQKSAVLANASPNFMVSELNPDAVGLRLGDAGALVRGTTELSLFTSGVYEIDSHGRILDRTERVVAECVLRAVVRIFETARHTSQEDFARGKTDGTTVLPLPHSEAAAPFAGLVQLALSEPATPRDGAVVAFSATGFPPRSSSASRWLVESPFATAPCMEVAPDPLPSCKEKPIAPGTRGTGPAGRLHADGFRASRDAAVCRYTLGGASDHGRLGLWLKLGREETPGVILETEQALSDGYAVRGRLVAARSGDVLSLDYERRLVRLAGATGPAPSPIAATRTRTQLGALGAAHEWHHVDVTWRQGVHHELVVDGLPLPQESPTPLDDPLALEVVFAPRDALTVGGTLDGSPCRCDATIDDLVLDDADLGVFSWTAQQPGKWGRVSFQPDEFALLVSLTNDGTTVKLQGDGSPVRAGSWNNGKGKGAQKPKPGKGAGGGKGKKGQDPLVALYPSVTSTDELPRLVHSGGSVAYEFAFVYDRGAFAQRGLAAPPLAVSPILEDVSLTYTRGAKVLRVEPLER